MNIIRLNASGVPFNITVSEPDQNDVLQIVDLSAASTKQFKFTKPDGSVAATVDVDFVTDGSDGRLQYKQDRATLPFDMVGLWIVEVNLVFPAGGYDGLTQQTTFRVQ